jgi:hypothetical protein
MDVNSVGQNILTRPFRTHDLFWAGGPKALPWAGMGRTVGAGGRIRSPQSGFRITRNSPTTAGVADVTALNAPVTKMAYHIDGGQGSTENA